MLDKGNFETKTRKKGETKKYQLIRKIFIDKPKHEHILGYISLIAGIIALITLIHTFIVYPTERTYGERFVLDHLWLRTPIYNFHFKPITIFVVFGLIFWVCGIESLRTPLSTTSFFFKRIIFIVSFVFFFVFFYEVLHAFVFWSAAYAINLGEVDINMVYSDSPAGIMVNYNTMTKFFTLILFLSLYTLYFFHGIMKNETVSQRKQ